MQSSIFSSFSDFDAIFYQKSGRYPYVSEQSSDIFKFLTNFTASAGAVVVSKEASAVFVDGRYTLAAKIALEHSAFSIQNLSRSDVIQWISQNISKGSCIAYDPRYFSIYSATEIIKQLPSYTFIPVDLEKVIGLSPVPKRLNIQIISSFDKSKFSAIYEAIEKNDLFAYLLSDPCSISWLLDVRDFSVPFSPIVFGYLLIKKDHNITFYLDGGYEKEMSCPSIAEVKSEKFLLEDLKKLAANGAKIGLDFKETSSIIQSVISNEQLSLFRNISNPCISSKAIKNSREITGMKEAAKADSAAIIQLLHWISQMTKEDKDLTEISVAKKLIEFRRQNPAYKGESFSCISAADEHSAIIHYSPTLESNSTIRNILLLDTGGQYCSTNAYSSSSSCNGTTDITRTICLHSPSLVQISAYTAVLKGHIAIANAKFPEGTTFAQIDAFARQFLWQYALDYPHSTSHGIGYISCVHENLAASENAGKAPLLPGMIISNEPGYYEENHFGIRLENMLLVKDENCRGSDNKRYLSFETISLVPFDMHMVDIKQLTDTEKKWLDNYHKKVFDELSGILPENVMEWLKDRTFAAAQ